MFVVHRKLYGISIAPVGVEPRDHTVIATASGYILAIEAYRSHQNSWQMDAHLSKIGYFNILHRFSSIPFQ